MAHPGDVRSDPTWPGYDFLDPDNRYRGLLEDYELGGIGISDSSQGLRYQVWHMTYVEDILDPDYGDFILTAEITKAVSSPINVANVVNLGFTFDGNMRPAICYELENGNSYYYWYDTSEAQFTTTQLPAGSFSPRMCLDDHRAMQNQSRDMILGYIRDGTLYYRQQRDRFLTERVWVTNVGLGPLNRIGMMDNLRVGYDVGSLDGVPLCEIVNDLCDAVDMPDRDTTELCEIDVRGFLVAGMYSAADTIRSLQKVYFFDMPEIDGKLRCILRGQDIEDTILIQDMVEGKKADIETGREQSVEYPRKLHLNYASVESDYTPTKQTSERRSPDVLSYSEVTLDSAVNHTADDAAQRADILHTLAWNEMEGYAKFSLPENWWRLAPSNPVLIEVRPGTYRRMRIMRAKYTEGQFEIEAVIDRASSYVSTATGVTNIPTGGASTGYPGPTIWEFMDLPALITDHDTLHYYTAAHGWENWAWRGYQMQRLIGTDWQKERDIDYGETMGITYGPLADADPYYIDRRGVLIVKMHYGAAESVDDDGIFSGRGAWLVGDEIMQVRDWVQQGEEWYGYHLFRGRLNTEAVAHIGGERVIYLGNPARIVVDVSKRDTDLTLRAVSFGNYAAESSVHTFEGKSQEEWPPDMLTWSKNGNDWIFNWVARYPLGNSANPIPHAQFYGWILRFTAGGSTYSRTIEGRTPTFTYTSAMQVADFGSNQSSFTTVEVRGLNHLGGEGLALTEASVS